MRNLKDFSLAELHFQILNLNVKDLQLVAAFRLILGRNRGLPSCGMIPIRMRGVVVRPIGFQSKLRFAEVYLLFEFLNQGGLELSLPLKLCDQISLKVNKKQGLHIHECWVRVLCTRSHPWSAPIGNPGVLASQL